MFDTGKISIIKGFMVSFIVIGRNEGWRLEKCFNGIYTFVQAEHIADYEVLYVDSKSTDGSVELSKRMGNEKTLLITGECNAAIARNIGAKEAKGDILFFIDGDMELLPGFWSSVVKEGEMVYPFVSGIEKDVLHDNDWNYVETQVRRNLNGGKDYYEVTTGGLFVIDAELWRMVGGMDNRFKRSQDQDLGFRLTKNGYKLLRKSQLWVNHYTRYYLTTFKYQALLTRKHFLNPSALLFLFGPNYPSWCLAISLLFILVTRTLWPGLLYLGVLCYRAFRTFKKNKYRFNPISTVITQIKLDVCFIYFFFAFWPKDIELKYEIK